MADHHPAWEYENFLQKISLQLSRFLINILNNGYSTAYPKKNIFNKLEPVCADNAVKPQPTNNPTQHDFQNWYKRVWF